MWRYRNKEQLSGWETGVTEDRKSTAQQKHRTPNSLKDIDKGLPHILKLFLEEADPLQMKTAGHKNTGQRLVEHRRLMMFETAPWCQPVWELSTGWLCIWEPPPSHYKTASLKAIREFRSSEHELPAPTWFPWFPAQLSFTTTQGQ